MLTHTTLTSRERDFLAMTGLTVTEYEQLLPAFTGAFERRYPPELTLRGKERQRRQGGGMNGVLDEMADKLLFILVYLKTNPLQVAQGLQFGMSQPQANYWIHRLLPVLQETLAELGMRPEREGSAVAASALAQEGTPDFAIDGTERRRERPQANGGQKVHYSGKKKTHTDKNILLINESTGKIVYLGPTEAGSKHDKKAADEAAIEYPLHASLDKDTGFQGYEPADVLTRQPQKSLEGRNSARRTRLSMP